MMNSPVTAGASGPRVRTPAPAAFGLPGLPDRIVVRTLARVALMLPLLACGAGCSTWSGLGSFFAEKEEVLPDEPAEKLYNEGVYYLNEKHDAKNASKKFEEVDRQHPYSEWARKSLLMSAYAYYEARSYEEC